MRAMLLVSCLLLAGCVQTPPSADEPGASAGASGWTLDCAQGGYEKALDPSWPQACVARASHTPLTKAEMWIAVNPTDPSNVVVGSKDRDPELSADCVWNGLGVTHDGGKTWADVVIGGTFAERGPTSPFFGYACNTDPIFQFTSDGALHYGVELYGFLSQNGEGILPRGTPFNTDTGSKILLATSHDGGDTWPDVITYQPDLLVTTDYSRMTIDPTDDAIIEAIGSDGGAGCHVLVSKDGGQTATFVEVVTPYGPACGSSGNTAIAASPDGVIVMLGGINARSITAASRSDIVVRSTDDGMTWLDSNEGFPYAPISSFEESEYRVGSHMELAYDLTDGPNRGTLYVVYPAAERDEADMYVRTSADDGRTWSDAVLINDDPEGAHQWMGNVAVASDGSVHVFYMDKRYDPAHKLIDMTHAVSTDGGATWTNTRVTTVSWDGDLGVHQTGVPFIGDYLGVACAGTECWGGFPDASLGEEPVAAAARVFRS